MWVLLSKNCRETETHMRTSKSKGWIYHILTKNLFKIYALHIWYTSISKKNYKKCICNILTLCAHCASHKGRLECRERKKLWWVSKDMKTMSENENAKATKAYLYKNKSILWKVSTHSIWSDVKILMATEYVSDYNKHSNNL